MDRTGSSSAEKTAPHNPRALLLDLDGTLANSIPAMQLVYRHFLEQYGAKPSAAEFARLNGPPLPEIVRVLKQVHRLPESEETLLAYYCDLVDETYAEVTPNQGAHKLLDGAKKAGCIVGIVTSNSLCRTRSWLHRVDFITLVDFVIAGEDVARGKPDPEPYLFAAARAGCTAGTAVAVEDSLAGALSARAAGLRTFMLHPETTSDLPEGVERVPSLSDLAERLWNGLV